MLTCYKIWCPRTIILITVVSEWHQPLLMLKTSVQFDNNYFTNTRKNQNGGSTSANEWESASESKNSKKLLARMVGRNFHHQQEISHYSGHLRDQGCGAWRDKRTVLRARASVDHQGGQRVWRLESVKDEKEKRKIQYYVKWKGYPDKFNSMIDWCRLVSANVGSSAKFPKEIIYFCQVLMVYIVVITSIVNLFISDKNTCLWSSLVSGSVGYLLLIPPINNKKANDVISYDSTIEQQHNDLPR